MPESNRIYMGSFWDQPLREGSHKMMMEKDMAILLADLQDLPNEVSEQRIQEMVIRIRLLRVHMCLMASLRAEMPWFCGKAKRKRHLLDNLELVIANVCEQYGFSKGDLRSVP